MPREMRLVDIPIYGLYIFNEINNILFVKKPMQKASIGF